MEKNLIEKKSLILEFILINYLENILKYYDKDSENPVHLKYLYTIKVLLKNNIKYLNKHLLTILNLMINYFDDDINRLTFIKYSKSIIIGNTDLTKYGDQTLFIHQKELFTRMKEITPKLSFFNCTNWYW